MRVPTTPLHRLPDCRQPGPGERIMDKREIEAALVGRLSRRERRALMHALSGVSVVALIEESPILGDDEPTPHQKV